MDAALLDLLIGLRICIGYLGEKEQFGWWQCSFFTEGSNAFLSPLFSRTKDLARCNGVTRAAALVHDERIGVGHVYHLFRLPEELEQGIHQVMHDKQFGEDIRKIISSNVSALGYLRKNSVIPNQPGTGPMRVGDIMALRDQQVWRIVAGLYSFSFETQKEILPYFTNLT